METTLFIISFIAVIGVVFLLKHHIEKIDMFKRNMSFYESLHLTGFPIVTLKNNGQFVNMILDSGSNRTLIDADNLEHLEYENLDCNSSVFGVDGIKTTGGYVRMPFEYKDKVYEIECCSINLSETFARMKEQYGITVNGILGTDFFEKYKYVLDFKDMVAYPKED